MARTSSKTTARKLTRKVSVQNPFTMVRDGGESKSAILFKMLTAKRGAHVEDLSNAIGWNVPTIRARINHIQKMGYNVEKIGGYGEPVYKVVA